MSPVLVPVVRLVRSRGAWLWSAVLSALVLAVASRERSHAAVHGAEAALDAYASVAVPLLAYGLVAAAVAPGGLSRSGRSLVRLGASPTKVALATVLAAMAASALLSGALGALAVAWAHGSADPALRDDVPETLAFGALAGAAYAAYFMLGSALVARAWGRVALLAIDWVVGSDIGLGALFTPRGHLRNLLGGEAPFEALPWESLVGLACLAVVFAAAAVGRASRARV